MAKPSKELTKKRAERAKSLFVWWKTTHPGEKKTQRILASEMQILPETLSAKLNAKRTLTEEDAKKIAAFFPGVRFEFIMCYDDYRTWEDRTKAVLDKSADDAAALDILIRRISKDAALSFMFMRKEEAPAGLHLDTDCYAIIENSTVVGLIPVSEYIALRHEIADFASFVVNKKISSCKKQLIAPFPYKED